MLLAGCATQTPVDGPVQVLIPVYYATNRSPLSSEDDDPGYYSDERGDLGFGRTLRTKYAQGG